MYFTSLMKFQTKKGWIYCLFILIVSLSIFMIHGIASAGPPLLNFEGVGGGGIVPGAYLVNPPQDGKKIGNPVLSSWHAIGGDSNFYTQGIALSMFDRVELGYSHEVFDFRRIKRKLEELSGGTLRADKDFVYQHDFHIKFLLMKEDKYIPAFALTTEFKFNDTIESINNNLGKPLDGIGYDDNFGTDFDFSFSKTFMNLIKFPVQTHFNLRLTKGAHTGFLGFSEDYTINPEIALGVMVHPDIIIGFEYRQKPDEYKSMATSLSGFTFKEDDFWDIFFSWMPSKRLSLSVAF
ncbi:MAG: DUF3034 family protein, partial [Syntrophales bacterium]|nr:DUF3034 family protein [Syntrophales bacterium]